MRSLRSAVVLNAVAFFACWLAFTMQAGEPPGKADQKIRDGAYYEFRGHLSDRDTIKKVFTLGWASGSQRILVTTDTKIFRQGKAARLEEAKSGDAARGVGVAQSGRLIAVAVAFGSEGVELPPNIKIPDSITLPPSSRE